MMSPTGGPVEPIEVKVSCATSEEARSIMADVVGRRLAACGHIWPMQTCYWWGGKVVDDDEYTLLLKTASIHFEAICEAIAARHSYELPSIVAVPLSGVGPGYLQWLMDSTGLSQSE